MSISADEAAARGTVIRMASQDARIAELEKALSEIQRRTGLLIHQNTGRWSMRVEHDKRTVDVLMSNQEIAAEALTK